MNKTNISYLTHTWNPIAMCCTPISEACEHCWHLQMCGRMAGNPKMPDRLREAYAGKSGPVLVENRLDDPLKVKKPARIGVQFMGDLFHGDVDWNWQYKIFEMMLHACWHKFLVLTKRPPLRTLENIWFHLKRNYDCHIFPLSNVWLGTTVETQQRADERIETLLQIPAAVRFLSLEPLLGDIDIEDGFYEKMIDHPHTLWRDRKGGRIGWVIIGGLSLPGGKIKPPKPEWVKSILEQCDEAGVPVFIKENCQYPEERREFPGETP